MFSVPIKEMLDPRKMLVAAPDASVAEAARLMARKKAGAVMVVVGQRLTGIFTERDAVFRVMAHGLDANATRLEAVMTPDPFTVSPDKTYGYALLLMQRNGFRHVPVTVDGKPVGIVSARNALDPELEEFTSETQRRLHLMASAA